MVNQSDNSTHENPYNGDNGTKTPLQNSDDMSQLPQSGASVWISHGWRLVMENLGIAIVLALIILIPQFLLGSLLRGGMRIPENIGSTELWVLLQMQLLPLAVLSIPSTLISTLISVGVLTCFWDGVKTGKLSLGKIWQGFKNPGNCLVLGIIFWAMQLIVVATSGICIGIILVFPALALSLLTQYDLTARAKNAGDAFASGWILLTQDYAECLITALISTLILILGLLMVGIGVLVALPIVLAAFGFCYEEIRSRVEDRLP